MGGYASSLELRSELKGEAKILRFDWASYSVRLLVEFDADKRTCSKRTLTQYWSLHEDGPWPKGPTHISSRAFCEGMRPLYWEPSQGLSSGTGTGSDGVSRFAV